MLIYRSEVCADLEGPEVRVDREDVDQLEGGEDVGGSEESLKHWVVTRHHIDTSHLRDECGVPGVPVLAWQTDCVHSQLLLIQDLTQCNTM